MEIRAIFTALLVLISFIKELKETLSKPRRRRQLGHGKTKDMMGRTIAQHVRLYISEPSYAKQQREITTICVVCEPKPRRQIILISIWNLTLF